jgi:hypothetical protein
MSEDVVGEFCRRKDDELKTDIAVLVAAVQKLTTETSTNVRYMILTMCMLALGKELVNAVVSHWG